jgi:chromosome segregation ATPase
MRKLLGGDVSQDELEGLLDQRRRELEEQAIALENAVADLERRESLLRDSRASLERLLRLGTRELDSRESEFAELIRELTAREDRLHEAENELTRRRSELGAVELKRASVEQRERALAEKEVELEVRERGAADAQPEAHSRTGPTAPIVELAFVPGERYRLVETGGVALQPGSTFTHDEEEYAVARLGPSPLPADSRRCAYLLRGPRGRSSDGSS